MNENSEKKAIETVRIFRLIYNLPSKTVFSIDGLKESEIDKIFEIESVSEVIYDPKTKQLEIKCDDVFPFMKILEGIKAKIPGAVFYKNPNEARESNITASTTIIQNLTKKGDDTVKNLFKGYADSQDLIFLFTSAMAAEELIRNPIMPKWYDWFRMAQAAHSDIKTKTELTVVEEEIKISEQVSIEDFKKLVISINELKTLIEKNFNGTGTK